MRWFKKLVNTVRSDGLYGPYHGKESSHGLNKLEPEMQKFFFATVVPECEIFVLHESQENINKVPKDFKPDTHPVLYDMPFSAMSVEYSNCHITVPMLGDAEVYTECVVVTEIGPLRYIIFGLIRLVDDRVGEIFKVICYTFSSNPSEIRAIDGFHFGAAFSSSLNKITSRSFKTGVEDVNAKVKIRPGGKNRNNIHHTIKRITHVSSEKSLGDISPSSFKGEIEWSHRWTSQGHWRNFYCNREIYEIDSSKVGKNRDGDYCERGRTWVKDSIKGPEGAPIIKKTRVVK